VLLTCLNTNFVLGQKAPRAGSAEILKFRPVQTSKFLETKFHWGGFESGYKGHGVQRKITLKQRSGGWLLRFELRPNNCGSYEVGVSVLQVM
jgi:hypothetical protein